MTEADIVPWHSIPSAERPWAVYAVVRQLQPNAFGATIQEEIERRHQKDVSAGWLYTTLDRLQTDGYLRCERKEEGLRTRGGRARIYWYPTGKPRLEEPHAAADWDQGVQPA